MAGLPFVNDTTRQETAACCHLMALLAEEGSLFRKVPGQEALMMAPLNTSIEILVVLVPQPPPPNPYLPSMLTEVTQVIYMSSFKFPSQINLIQHIK